MNPSLVVRRTALSPQKFCACFRWRSTALSSGLYKKGHFMALPCEWPHSPPQKGSGLSSAPWTWPLPSRLRALGIMGVGSSRIQGVGGGVSAGCG